MTGLYLYDDEQARSFEPFALTRPVGELVAGAALQRDRWQTALQLAAVAHITAPHLVDFEEPGAVGSARGGIPAGSVVVNSRFVPKLTAATASSKGDEHGLPDLWIARGRTVAVRTTRELP